MRLTTDGSSLSQHFACPSPFSFSKRPRLDENGDRRREGGSGHVPSSSTIPASGTTPGDLHGGPRSTGGVQSHHQRAHCRRTTWSAAVWDRCVVENHVGFSSASQEQARS